MTESEVRQVLLVQAHETAAGGGETALWTAADRDWATRLARETASAGVPFERFLVERSRHALERLLPRDTAGRRWLARRGWRPLWVLAVVVTAFTAGVAVDHLGAPSRVDLLMPALWAVVAWNVAVVMALLLPRRPGALRRALAGRWLEGSSPPAALWARAAAPLALARAALLLHAGALALAAGIVAGMYLRGLVLDYRAGWQSTFLEPPHVQLLLETLLAPARAVTGIVLPEVAPLRVEPGAAASAGASPWIHLYAATLALFVGLPRGLLLLWAAVRAAWLARRLPLSLDSPYFEALRRRQAGGRAVVAVWPHAAPLAAPAALGLRARLAGVFDEGLELQLRPPVAYGDEEFAGATDADAAGAASLRLALFDLGTTPEAEVQGRLLQALAAGAGGARVLAVVDEAAFRRRFANLPERLAERRAAWQRLCAAQGVALLCTDLESADVAAGSAALQAALQAAPPAPA